MKHFHHVHVSVFIREEPLDFLAALLPIPPADFLSQQFKYDPDLAHTRVYALKHATLRVTENPESNLKVFKFTLAKQSDSNSVFRQIMQGISAQERAQFKKEAKKYVDEEGTLFLRLDKLELEKGRCVLTTAGNCVHFTFSLAAYPKNERTVFDALQKLLATID